jgi:hypothetical protein
MAVLVQGFAIVAPLEAIDARCPGGWDGFVRLITARTAVIAFDDELVSVSFGTRPEFRELLAWLARRGFAADAERILAATELSPNSRSPEEIAALQEQIAQAREIALVYREQKIRPDWVDVTAGRLPGGGPVVAGAFLVGGESQRLAVPEGWTAVQAAPARDEPESGDELLPTWHEVLRDSSAEMREELMRAGPEAFQSYCAAVGHRILSGPIRPSPNVIEQEVVVRDPDGTERVMVQRWTKLSG